MYELLIFVLNLTIPKFYYNYTYNIFKLAKKQFSKPCTSIANNAFYFYSIIINSIVVESLMGTKHPYYKRCFFYFIIDFLEDFIILLKSFFIKIKCMICLVKINF